MIHTASHITDDKNIHAGHRDRLRNRLLMSGVDESIPDHEILEYLLCHTIPRRDTNYIAHRLVNIFGSLAGVMDADIDDLVNLGGITKNSAILIKMILPISRAYNLRSTIGKKVFENCSEIAEYIHSLYAGYEQETVSILLINQAGCPIRFERLATGDISSVNLSIKTLVDKALRSGATTVALAHNHPHGVALPSMEDLQVTREVRLALSHLGIKLIDHIIVADDKYISLASSEKFSKIF